MDEYKIIITPDAETDLNELDDYISFYLMAPDIAISCIRYIRSKIAGLRKAPKRYRLIEDEPWHSRGIRRMNAKNFAVFSFAYELPLVVTNPLFSLFSFYSSSTDCSEESFLTVR